MFLLQRERRAIRCAQTERFRPPSHEFPAISQPTASVLVPLTNLCTTGADAEETELSYVDVSIADIHVQLKGKSEALQKLPVCGVLQCRWKDQGWGNQRASLHLKLMAPDGSEKASLRLNGGFSPHDWEDVKVDLAATEPVLAQAEVGCWYEVMANEGKGGGHEINVESLVLWLAGDNQPVYS